MGQDFLDILYLKDRVSMLIYLGTLHIFQGTSTNKNNVQKKDFSKETYMKAYYAT